MSEIIDSIKQGASQVISGIDQKGQIKAAIDGLRTQWSELERKRRIGQLEGQIKSLQGEMKQLTEALGLQTLSLFDSGTISHPELTRVCGRINELRAETEQKKSELTELKATVGAPPPKAVSCPRCQTRVSSADEFCPKCGERLQKPAPAAQPAAQPVATTAVRLRCPKCKTILPEGAGFCPTCGVKIKQPQAAQAAAKRFCASCGAEISPTARFCPVCGQTTG